MRVVAVAIVVVVCLVSVLEIVLRVPFGVRE
jgi:hypothetical protein